MSDVKKFRAWDEQFKTMRYNAVVGIDHQEQKIDFGLLGGSSAHGFEVFFGRWTGEKTFEYMPVMQFMDLEDVDKVPVYEGDILVVNRDHTMKAFNGRTLDYTEVVKSIHDRSKLMAYGVNSIKVIGNIHANPDMIP